jgi:hypothetical protein
MGQFRPTPDIMFDYRSHGEEKKSHKHFPYSPLLSGVVLNGLSYKKNCDYIISLLYVKIENMNFKITQEKQFIFGKMHEMKWTGGTSRIPALKPWALNKIVA